MSEGKRWLVVPGDLVTEEKVKILLYRGSEDKS